MRAFAFIFIAAAAPKCLALPDARRLTHEFPRITASDGQFRLTASDGAANDRFGRRVAISGRTVVVGAWRWYCQGCWGVNYNGGSYSNTAYIYYKTDDGDYVEIDKIEANEHTEVNPHGTSVAIDGDTVVIGAEGTNFGVTGQAGYYYGTVYVYDTRDCGESYRFLEYLIPNDNDYGDNFGCSVAINGDTLVVGASAGGAVYVFRTIDSGAQWPKKEQVAKLTASDGASKFGHSVAIDGDTVVIGAYKKVRFTRRQRSQR